MDDFSKRDKAAMPEGKSGCLTGVDGNFDDDFEELFELLTTEAFEHFLERTRSAEEPLQIFSDVRIIMQIGFLRRQVEGHLLTSAREHRVRSFLDELAELSITGGRKDGRPPKANIQQRLGRSTIIALGVEHDWRI